MSAHVRASIERLVQSSRTPGLQYVVVDRSRTVFEHVAGSADLAASRPMTSATTMMAYSMSKTVTAAAVLQLVEARRVDLDEPIGTYRVSHPYGAGVTVRRLLSHTAGIPNPIPLRWVHPLAEHPRFDEAAALAALLQRYPRLAFPPGTRYRYSNLGYWLLGGVVEEASGERFTEYVTRHVLEPLGIEPQEAGYQVVEGVAHATGYLERYSLMNAFRRLLIHRALVGETAGRWVAILAHYLNGPAFGGLVGTARGFARFLQDQLAPRSGVLGEPARGLFYTPQRTRRGRPIAMTLGWHVGASGGVPCFYKEGGGGGFHCMMRLYPKAGIGTVLMTNATRFDVGGHMDSWDSHFLPHGG